MACFNGFIFIDATGGSGGGIFRYMYGRYFPGFDAVGEGETWKVFEEGGSLIPECGNHIHFGSLSGWNHCR